MQSLRDRLVSLVARAGSARELSRRAGLAEIHVGQILRRLADDDNANIERRTLQSIARGGGVSERWLLFGEGEPDAAHPPDDPPPTDLRHAGDDASRSIRPELRAHPYWPELEAGARAKAAELGRTFPEWAWEAVAGARLVMTAEPDIAGVFDLVKLHFERGWGRPPPPRVETGPVKARGPG